MWNMSAFLSSWFPAGRFTFLSYNEDENSRPIKVAAMTTWATEAVVRIVSFIFFLWLISAHTLSPGSLGLSLIAIPSL